MAIDYSVRYIQKVNKQKKKRLKQKQKKLVHFLVNKTKIFHNLSKIPIKK